MLLKITSFLKKLNDRLEFEKAISRNKIYKMIDTGEIQARRIGFEYFIEESELENVEKITRK